MLDIFEINYDRMIGGEVRKAYVYTPEGFEEDRRFPVLYMFDGHNVFLDEEATYGKSWGMLEYLEENHVPLIVAGIECSHHAEDEPCGGRLSEYSPFDFTDPWIHRKIKGRGRITMEIFTEEFKPLIDENYPTLSDREHTFIAGSSMGGLMSVYALMEYNHIFSKAAGLSPSFGFDPLRSVRMVKNARIDRNHTTLYMDYGQNEFRRIRTRETYGDVCKALMRKGVLLASRIVPDGTHSEASWEKQIPYFMQVFFYEEN